MSHSSEGTSKMFWGLVLQPDKRYEQTVEEAFHVSKACLELTAKGGQQATLSVESEGEDFIAAHLSDKNASDSLDLNFAAGEQICFKTSGSGVVHLTGYLHPDDDDDGPYFSEGESDSEEEDMPALISAKKRKGLSENGDAGGDNVVQQAKKAKLERKEAIKTAEAASKKLLAEKPKKGKPEQAEADDDEDDEEDDSDEYEDMEEDGEEEEESDDDDDDDEEEDVEEEEETPKKKKQEQGGSKKKEQQNKQTPTPKKDAPQNGAAAGKTPKKGDQTDNNKTPKKDQQQGKPTPKKTPKRTIKGGIVVEELKEGNGPEAKRGKTVGMFYDGRLQTNNKRFDATLNGKPFAFKLGKGEVIKGWDLGVEGMKVGGKRKLTIPAKMAYGSDGAAPDIPPNATLVFEVECKFVK